jgi:hypothetical protein
VSYIGYISKKISLGDIQPDQPIILSLDEDTMGEVVTTAGFIVVKYRNLPSPVPIKYKKQPSSIIAYSNPVFPGSPINIQRKKIDDGKYLAEIYNVSGQRTQSSIYTFGKYINRSASTLVI